MDGGDLHVNTERTTRGRMLKVLYHVRFTRTRIRTLSIQPRSQVLHPGNATAYELWFCVHIWAFIYLLVSML